jgi:hypothetical protein
MTKPEDVDRAPVHAVVMPRCCETCRYVDKFEPREDEKKMGLVLGCKKPGWEGYTSPLRMACGGQFYWPKESA